MEGLEFFRFRDGGEGGKLVFGIIVEKTDESVSVFQHELPAHFLASQYWTPSQFLRLLTFV